MRSIRAAAAVWAALALAGMLPVPAGAAPSDDPKTQLRAKEWLSRAQTGNIDRTQLTPATSTALNGDVIAATKETLGKLGAPVDFTLRAHYEIDGNSVYVYRAAFKDAAWNEQISFDGQGKISGLFFRPAPDPNETPLPGEDPQITARAKAEFEAWRRGEIDRSHYTASAAADFNGALVARVAAELGALGAPAAFIFRGKTAPSPETVYAYLVTCANAEVWMTFGIDGAGKISAIAFQPE